MQLLVLLLVLLTSQVTSDKKEDVVYKYRSYSEMIQTMVYLNETYPEIVDLVIGQEKYNLPYPPELQCSTSSSNTEEEPCKQYILTITDESSWTPSRPEVFLSGALHGNERIGPNSVMELAILLVENPNLDPWLSFLVKTRTIVIMPTTNAWGYDHNKRTELNVDTNRDYNYMMSGENCMQAMTSRVVNEVWRSHIFQLSLTYHAGMRAIAYEWGSPNHYVKPRGKKSEKSPDDVAQFELSTALSTYGGKFDVGSSLYPIGTMNDLVYGVKGGFEDWAYAASWENSVTTDGRRHDPFKPCNPSTFGGYEKERTIYNNASHRAFNILVETSNDKIPAESTLGNSYSLLPQRIQKVERDDAIGHVPRNMRLGLEVIEMVQPYVVWGFDKILQHEDLSHDDATNHNIICKSVINCGVILKEEGTVVRLEWEVLGAFTVEETVIEINVNNTGWSSSTTTLSDSLQSGFTRRNVNKDVTTFRYDFSPSDYNGDNEIQIRARAMVDQGWASQDVATLVPHVPPQSHVVNARTNPDWNMENAGRKVNGRLYWYSEIITFTVPDTATTAAETPTTTDTPSTEETPSTKVPSTEETPSTDTTTTETPSTTDTPSTEIPSTKVPSSTTEEPSKETSSTEEPKEALKVDDVSEEKKEEQPTFASALGYLVVGVGGMLFGAILAVLWLRVLSTSASHERRRVTTTTGVANESDEDQLLGQETAV